MNRKYLKIIHLYPKEMNIYGDTGNTMVLAKRLEWRGIDAVVIKVGIGDKIPKDADIIVGGGGQDAGQDDIQNDLQAKKLVLKKLADDGVVMLMICGMYQLFGRSFVTGGGRLIKGIGILPLITVASKERHIGNTIYSSDFGEIVGYENHSGLTTLDDPRFAFAKVKKGAGNSGHDNTEGCRVKNIFGTYSHGPILSKNPDFADALLETALKRKYPEMVLKVINNDLEDMAHNLAKKRPR